MLNSKKCQLPNCLKTFVKENGAFQFGKWFCCEKHAKEHPDTIRMQQINSKIKESSVAGTPLSRNPDLLEDEDNESFEI